MRSAILLASLILPAFIPQPASAQRVMIRAELDGRTIDGLPLVLNQRRVILVGRDGYLWDFPRPQATSLKKLSESFSAYSAAQMRASLAREYGSKFAVTGTGHYLIVHPAGQRDQWAGRFELLYRQFVTYFSKRGYPIHEPRFPLVAVVFANYADYRRDAAARGISLAANVVGYYSPKSNRVSMYSQGGGRRQWHETAATIIHEATHQTAYNTGVHNRFGQAPAWVVEGLGTMFEARGVWNGSAHPQASDRINRGQLASFQSYAAGARPRGMLAEIVAHDRLFRTRPREAYAESWALSFFLSETQPQRYAAYLSKTAGRQAFRNYTPGQRLADFTAVFGENLELLESQYLRYLKSLR
ncbi:MAG: DUF1570 domain-containing protein [Planctomycetes bacterium]|nr:DUF1570 domain-containing protein [Planctomycetota bacterium]